MKLQKRLILNFKITHWVKKRNQLKEISPWKKVDIEILDSIIARLEAQLKEGSDA